MTHEPNLPDAPHLGTTELEAPAEPTPRRLFLREPGWRIGQKIGSIREYCYAMAPGQDYYHRLGDGELYVYHGGERLCLACAHRRGLLAYQPRILREPGVGRDLESLEEPYDLGPAPDPREDDYDDR